MVSTSVELVVLVVWIVFFCWLASRQQRVAMRELAPDDSKASVEGGGFRWVFAKTPRGKRAARLALLGYFLATAGALGWAVLNGLAARSGTVS